MEPEEYQRNYDLEDWHWWFVGRQSTVKNLLQKSATPGGNQRILDVGCGTGAMTKLLGGYGGVVGVDISEIALGFCRKRDLDSLCQATALQLPFADDSFELVTAFDVVYHKRVEDDLEALKEFRRVCKNNGLLLITACAFDFLRGEHDVVVHGARRYTQGELTEKLKRAGFDVEKATYTNALLFPLLLTSRLWGKLRRSRGRAKSDLVPVNRYLNTLLAWISRLEAFSLKRIDLPFGSSVLCLARKRGAGASVDANQMAKD